MDSDTMAGFRVLAMFLGLAGVMVLGVGLLFPQPILSRIAWMLLSSTLLVLAVAFWQTGPRIPHALRLLVVVVALATIAFGLWRIVMPA